jgi:hypothetical protein
MFLVWPGCSDGYRNDEHQVPGLTSALAAVTDCNSSAPGTGGPEARLRSAFRILAQGRSESVATSCGKVRRQRESGLMATAFTPPCMSVLPSSASPMRASIGISSFARDLCNELIKA